jgi:hypothetical protein
MAKEKQQQGLLTRKHYISLVWIVVALLMAVLYFDLLSFSVRTTEPSVVDEKAVPKGVYDNETAFVFGAVGIYSTTELFKCMSAMESLSKVGGWRGPIYLLIDQESCLDQKLIKSFPNKNIHIVHVQKERRRRMRRRLDEQTRETAEEDHHQLKDLFVHNNSSPLFRSSESQNEEYSQHRQLLSTQPFERTMAVKMHILDYLPSNIQYAIWYDCDVLWVKPNCVQEMLNHKPQITAEKPIFLSIPGHVGSFVVKNGVSGPALQAWKTELLASNSPSALESREAIQDFKVFINLFGKYPNDTNAKFGLLHSSYKDVMPKGFAPNNHSIYENATECIVHLSNGRCRHLLPNKIDAFLQTLHLKSYEGQKWCPSVLRRKFKNYGLEWPFCWNPPFFWNA